MGRLLLRWLQLAIMYRHIDNSWADQTGCAGPPHFVGQLRLICLKLFAKLPQ